MFVCVCLHVLCVCVASSFNVCIHICVRACVYTDRVPCTGLDTTFRTGVYYHDTGLGHCGLGSDISDLHPVNCIHGECCVCVCVRVCAW